MMNSNLYNDKYFYQYMSRIQVNLYNVIAECIVEMFRPKRVLDVGCAMGFLVKAFQELGVKAYGIDISHYAVKNRIVDTVFIGNAANIPFKDESFDLIIALDLIEHLENPEVFISEAHRLLTSNGVLVIRTCSPNSENARADPTHVTILQEKDWEVMFKKFNFVRSLKEERSFRKGIASRLASYYTSRNPNSFFGKVLELLGIRKHAVAIYLTLKELYIQPRYDYYFILRRC